MVGYYLVGYKGVNNMITLAINLDKILLLAVIIIFGMAILSYWDRNKY